VPEIGARAMAQKAFESERLNHGEHGEHGESKTEGRRQKAEGRRQKAEGRIPMIVQPDRVIQTTIIFFFLRVLRVLRGSVFYFLIF
jgi:hypothetical protein